MTVEQKKIYGCVAGCSIMLLLLALITLYFEPTISRDGTFYLKYVGIWQENGCFQAIKDQYNDFRVPPFYLWLIKCLIDIGFAPEVAGRGISLIGGMTVPLCVYLIAQEVQKDKRVSLTAALLLAVNPTIINYSIEIQRDMFYFSLFGWTIYFCLRGILRNEIWSWIPAGILFGCSVLTRYETLELLPILLFAFLLYAVNKKIGWKRFFSQSAVMACSCFISIVLLIYVMGIEEYILNYYRLYFSMKFDAILDLYVAPDAGIGDLK